ncbi:hypothetical protein FB567DRAFT_539295 [Paraphoma chrysanthemicola]|uniref:Uncharacterized protein n=1 Tax=Paraphoma chrysanthemicola TaxID=798071 RepID=A0A8K0VT48_9PLEO|nr:hypothetical protein FB567DRAFT_539295 [Paraphoma chrysanthemicola]
MAPLMVWIFGTSRDLVFIHQLHDASGSGVAFARAAGGYPLRLVLPFRSVLCGYGRHAVVFPLGPGLHSVSNSAHQLAWDVGDGRRFLATAGCASSRPWPTVPSLPLAGCINSALEIAAVGKHHGSSEALVAAPSTHIKFQRRSSSEASCHGVLDDCSTTLSQPLACSTVASKRRPITTWLVPSLTKPLPGPTAAAWPRHPVMRAAVAPHLSRLRG